MSCITGLSEYLIQCLRMKLEGPTYFALIAIEDEFCDELITLLEREGRPVSYDRFVGTKPMVTDDGLDLADPRIDRIQMDWAIAIAAAGFVLPDPED